MGEQRRHDGYFDFSGTVVTTIDSHYLLDAYDMGVPASVAPPNAARYTYDDGVAIIDDIESFRNTSGIMFPHSPPFNHPTLPLPMQGMRGHSLNFHPPAPSHCGAAIPTQMGARHVGAATSSTDHIGVMPHRNLPPMGFIQLDDVALLADHHTDLHLDIEDMSYEELLALGERIGNVSMPLSDEMVTTQMKTKTHSISATASEDQETDICIICQDEYKNQEKIGILQCGHEYHADCLRKWLLVKNVCPICKSEALIPGGR